MAIGTWPWGHYHGLGILVLAQPQAVQHRAGDTRQPVGEPLPDGPRVNVFHTAGIDDNIYTLGGTGAKPIRDPSQQAQSPSLALPTWKNSAILATWLAQAHLRASGTSSPTYISQGDAEPGDVCPHHLAGNLHSPWPLFCANGPGTGPRVQQEVSPRCPTHPIDEDIFGEHSLGFLDAAEAVHHLLDLKVPRELQQTPSWHSAQHSQHTAAPHQEPWLRWGLCDKALPPDAASFRSSEPSSYV